MITSKPVRKVAFMDKRVSFYTEAIINDGAGGSRSTYAKSFETWASVEPLSASQLYYYGRLPGDNSYKLVIRYRELDRTNKYQVKFGTRSFNLMPPLNSNEDNKYIEFIANELV